jgi:hypothetical protein
MTLPSDPKLLIPILRTALPKLMAQSIVGVQPMSIGAVYAPYIPKMKPESKYKFSRAKWYEADHRYEDYEEVIAWCTEHFGPRPRYPDAWTRWCDIHIDRIRFRDEKDYVLFCLRWGS